MPGPVNGGDVMGDTFPEAEFGFTVAALDDLLGALDRISMV
jgi:hypothetical protein